MSMNFEQYAAKGNEMINYLATDLSVTRDQAARVLRATLHTLRNRLSIEENFDLIAQLPMVIKAVYVDGWKPERQIHQSHHLIDFLDEIKENDHKAGTFDFGDIEQTIFMVRGAFRVISKYVSNGELNDIIHTLPLKIRDFIINAIDEGQYI